MSKRDGEKVAKPAKTKDKTKDKKSKKGKGKKSARDNSAVSEPQSSAVPVPAITIPTPGSAVTIGGGAITVQTAGSGLGGSGGSITASGASSGLIIGDPTPPPAPRYTAHMSSTERILVALAWARSSGALVIRSIDAHVACPDGWTPAFLLAAPEIGGAGAERRIRELRNVEPNKIESRQVVVGEKPKRVQVEFRLKPRG